MNAQRSEAQPSSFQGRVQVTGMVLEVRSLSTRSGRPFTGMTVDQAGECFEVYAPAEFATSLQPGQLINVEGPMRQARRRIEMTAHELKLLDADSIGSSAVAMLPKSACPVDALSALQALEVLEFRLPTHLRGFLIRVLLDSRISRPLLQCKASVRHHHAGHGGLLVHSTQLLPVIPALCDSLLPDDSEAWALASLGYLFHDVGKVVTIGSAAYPATLRNLRHESEGLWLLAPHLQWLEERDPASAVVLRYIFDFVATPAAERKQAKYLVADMVVMLDRLSAGADNRRGKSDLLKGLMIRPAANDALYEQEKHSVLPRVEN